MDRAPVTLSAGEWQVMEALWEGPRTLMELVRLLKERTGWAKSTVTTMVRRMEDKGLLAYRQEGRTKTFLPAVSREDAAVAETESLLRRAYHGSVGLLVNAMIQHKSLSKTDLDGLYAILRQAEEGEEESK